MSEKTITLERKGHVLSIGLNRPGKMNAFNLQMLLELGQAYAQYEADKELWCAVLYAHGDNFTAGLDLAEVGPHVASGEPLFPEGALDPMGLSEPRRSKPVICAVQGWCLTIGVELMLASDINIAADDARMAQIEIKRGFIPFGGATIRFAQVAGWGNAMRWLLTGGEFHAPEALRMGLVQEVVPAKELRHRAEELAAEVAAQAPLAVQATIKSARTALEQGSQAAIAEVVGEARRLMATEDAREGLSSFLERRQAVFKGE